MPFPMSHARYLPPLPKMWGVLMPVCGSAFWAGSMPCHSLGKKDFLHPERTDKFSHTTLWKIHRAAPISAMLITTGYDPGSPRAHPSECGTHTDAAPEAWLSCGCSRPENQAKLITPDCRSLGVGTPHGKNHPQLVRGHGNRWGLILFFRLM